MFFQNSPALLTVDTFAYDYYTGKFHINAANPEYMQWHAFEYPALETLIEIEGVENFTLKNIAFAGTTCGYGCDHVYRCGQANTIPHLPDMRAKAAAFFARNVRGLTVDGCTFRHLGTNGIQIVDKSVRTVIKNNRFKDVSMSGILVGNPAFKWQEDKYRTFALRIENNYLGHIGYEYPASCAIYVAPVDGLKILHNTVEDCAYSAISVGWTWTPQTLELGEKVNIRSAEIAFNYFHNYMQLLRDGGAIYVLGSNCNHNSVSERFNRMHDNFAILDTLSKKYGKYGYYCDGSASNWDVSHSVVINTYAMPIFSQPYPGALSYHNHFHEIYSTTEKHPSTLAPERDIITTNYSLVTEGPEALFEKYPETLAIRDAAGCTIIP